MSAARTDRSASRSGSSPAVLRVDTADDDVDGRAEVAQGVRRGPDRAPGGDDVLDEGDVPGGHVGALGQPASPVVLGLLPHEHRG